MELRRRNVFRVAGLYIIVSWLVLQVADVFMSFLPLPEWTPNLVFVLLVLGFPVALVMAWAFELTPDGIQLEQSGSKKAPAAFRAADGILLLALAVIGIYAYLSRGDSKPAPVPAAVPTVIDSIVVLPLEDLTNDPGQAYFVSGMHEALITELSKVEALRVISRTSAMAYQGSDKPLPEIARELGVRAVVEGSVLRAGDTVRITAQLIEAGSDRHLWADNYDRPMTDILTLYGEVARAIVEQIQVKVTPAEANRLGAVNAVDPAAYELYLQSRYLCDNWSPSELAEGIERARSAIVIDSDWAPAHAVLAMCLQYAAFFNYLKPLEVREEALGAARRALALGPQLAESHAAMAGVQYYLAYDRDGAERQLREALQLNPGSARALIHLSWLLGEAGRFDEGLAVTLKAIEHDPINTVTHHALGQLYSLAHRHEEALDAYREAANLDPRDPFLQYSLGLCQLQLGRGNEAIELMEEALRLSNRAPLYLAGMVYVLGDIGRVEEASVLMEELVGQESAGAYELGMAYVGLGQLEYALDALERAVAEFNVQVVYLPHSEVFDPLRDSPRFQKLIGRLGW